MSNSNLFAQWDTGKKVKVRPDEVLPEEVQQKPEPEQDKDSPVEEPSVEDATPQTDPEPEVNEADTWKKRRDDLKVHYDQTVETHKKEIQSKEAEIEALKKQLTEAQVPEIPSTEAELKEFQTKHPTVYNHVISMIRKELLEKESVISSELDQVRTKQREYDDAQKILKIKEKHPDAGTLRTTPEFETWLEAQSKGVKALFESNEPEDIIEGFDLYKLKLKAKAKVKQERETNAEAVTSGKSSDTNKSGDEKMWLESEIAKLSDAAYAKFEQEILKAQRDGRVLIGR